MWCGGMAGYGEEDVWMSALVLAGMVLKVATCCPRQLKWRGLPC
jgi:hypothetical protein